MICQRCGWCCYGIPAHLPRGDSKMGSELCPYLSFDQTKAVCTIYGEPDLDTWKKNPCGKYKPSYDNDPLVHARPCKMGFWIHEQGGLLSFIKNRPDICKSSRLIVQAMMEAYPVVDSRPNKALYLCDRPARFRSK